MKKQISIRRIPRKTPKEKRSAPGRPPRPSQKDRTPPELAFRAERLKEMRLNRMFTQNHLAHLMDTDERRISEWEGKHTVPNLYLLRKLAQALDVSADYLLGLVDDSKHFFAAVTPDLRAIEQELREFNEADRKDILRTVKLLKHTRGPHGHGE